MTTSYEREVERYLKRVEICQLAYLLKKHFSDIRIYKDGDQYGLDDSEILPDGTIALRID